MKNYALALYLLAILGAILFLAPPCKMRVPQSPLIKGGGAVIWEPERRAEDQSPVFGRPLTPLEVAVSDGAALRPLSVEQPSLQEVVKPIINATPKPASQWPKTYKAPDGVNTITENEDGTGSMTLAWAPKPKPGELVVRGNDDTYSRISLDEAAKRQQKHVITQAEAEEVVKLLSDHVGNLGSFLEQLRQERRADDAAKISTDMGIAKAMLAKWRKRIEEAKP